ncbi:MAG: peroxidase family protein [Acidimicrobiia bacterium]
MVRHPTLDYHGRGIQYLTDRTSNEVRSGASGSPREAGANFRRSSFMANTPSQHGRDEPAGSNRPLLEGEAGRFGRLFPELHGLYVPRHVLDALAAQMQDPDPPATPTQNQGWGTPQPPPTNDGDNETIPAGYTYLGQFVDHDLTFDPVSSLQHGPSQAQLANFRIPRLDLDSVYGGGPAASPSLYDRHNPGKLLVETTDEVDDLPRNAQQVALTGDPRNDENLIVAQLHLVFIKLHNHFIDTLTASDPADRFEEASRLTRWHYQWTVVWDFLTRVVGTELVAETLSVGPAFFRWPYQVFMPMEFSASAYRFGHSMVRPRYAIQPGPNELPVFGPEGGDLRGGRRLTAELKIDWAVFFERGQPGVQPSRKIDTKLAPSLFSLFGTGDEAAPSEDQSLASRNLRRGVSLGLPSGEAIYRRMTEALMDHPHRVQPVAVDTAELGLVDKGWAGETPLWAWILTEAGVHQGSQLGPVGGRIVAETILGLLAADPSSWLHSHPNWQPAEAHRTMPGLLDLIGA